MVAVFADATIRPTSRTRALPTAVALLMAAHVEITQHIAEDGSISRVVSWPERCFNLEHDASDGSWTLHSGDGTPLSRGHTSEEALRAACFNLPD